jgi:hypothetical protein
MAVRVPLPNRRQLQSLTGLIQAIKYHLNVSSNTIITDDSALGYINLAEDLDIAPIKTFSMKRSEFITVDENGQFNIEGLSYPMTEIIGVYYQFDDLYQQNEYLQYVDPVTFGKGYGTVYTDALYTIKTSDDGTNNQVLAVYPSPPSAKVGIEYYADWPKLGDLTDKSRLQQVYLTITGTATTSGTMTIVSTVNGVATPVIAYEISAGMTAEDVKQLIMFNEIPFQSLPGNNLSLWFYEENPGTTDLLLYGADYIEYNSALTIAAVPAGLTITATYFSPVFVQTVQSNWFLWQYPYVYYYGALKHAYNGLDDLERYQLVEKEFQKAAAVFQAFTDRAEWAGSNRQFDYNQNIIW